MFEAVRNNKRIAQVVLLIICLPFVFFGMDAYLRRDGAANEIARVGNAKITLGAFQNALRDEQNRIRQQNPAIDSAKLDTPALREALLNKMIDEEALGQEVRRLRLAPDNQAIYEMIHQAPTFQENGQFSRARYDRFLISQGMSAPQFEAIVARDMALQMLGGALGDAAFVPQTVKSRLIAEKIEERSVAQSLVPTDSKLKEATVAESDVQKFYDANPERFTTPERVKAQYVVLSQDELASDIVISDQQISDWYQSHLTDYGNPETRRVRHILLTGKDAEEQAKALSADLKKDPSRFAALAKEKSQDPGSAAQGGDLGAVGRGMMVKPFDEAVFSLQQGVISDPVKTDFGWHVIEVTEIHPAAPKPLAEVRDEISTELRTQAAQKRFNDTLEDFKNQVYDAPDSLNDVATRWKLPLHESGWLTQAMSEDGSHPATPNAAIEDDPRFVAAVFKDDVLKDGHNSDTLMLSPTVAVAARVSAHEKAEKQPFAAVKAQIEAELQREKARALAIEEGKALLAQCQQGEGGCKANWATAQTASRVNPGVLPAAAVEAVFAADATKLPAYVGLPIATGYALFKIEAVKPGQIAPQIETYLGDQIDALQSQAQ
ncbi:MAG: SurA N-terminal domain-containing protein, partial [Zoogloeaceae bacterium]|nr:SurA N-terminal domain-containing protein [Zoogloeaceae bacterium]